VPPPERDPAGRSPSAPGGYRPVARALHWLVAALAVIVVAFGWAAETAARNTPARASLLLLHRSLGLTILALMVLRVLWRARHPAPALPAALGRFDAALTRATHLALYLVFIAMPLAGYLNAAAAGHKVSLFGAVSIPPLSPRDERLAQAAIAAHLVGQYLVYLLVGVHVAGAFVHPLVGRLGVIERMLPRRPAPLAARPARRRPG